MGGTPEGTGKRRRATRHGYIVVDKPGGWTSHDVVARVRRVLGERRVGHAGTLDPAAVGVLPIAVGLATRTVEYLAGSSKSYRASVTFGVETDSHDADGTVTRVANVGSLDLSNIEPVLATFRGTRMQVPPVQSAIRVGGQRLYDIARTGQTIDVPSREVTMHSLAVVDWRSPTLTIDVTCSKGTYMRSLARDLGARLETGAYLSHLARTRSGPFTLDQAVLIDDLGMLHESLGWGGLAYHPDWVLQHMPAVVLDDGAARSWAMGQTVQLRRTVDGTVRTYDHDGEWLGIGEAGGCVLRPTKVIPPAWPNTLE